MGTNLVCESCDISDKENTFSSTNKYFNCEDELRQGCEKCEFVLNEENEEILKCIECKNKFILNSDNGRCVSKKSYYEKIVYCTEYNYYLIEENMNKYFVTKY